MREKQWGVTGGEKATVCIYRRGAKVARMPHLSRKWPAWRHTQTTIFTHVVTSVS